MRILDLFSGLGGFSQAFVDRGHEVVRVDIEAKFHPSLVADVLQLEASQVPGPWDAVLVSPPWTEFARESMPWSKTGKPPDLQLVVAGYGLVRELRPRWWVLENVRGAVPWLRSILGKPTKRCGAFYLWGDFPPLDPRMAYRKKEAFAGHQSAERAKVPYALSRALCLAMEANA